MKTTTVLKRVREYIEQPYHWHKGSLRRKVVIKDRPPIISVCLLGALSYVAANARKGEHEILAAKMLLNDTIYEVTGRTDIVSFNDYAGTRKKDVLRVLDEAIARSLQVN